MPLQRAIIAFLPIFSLAGTAFSAEHRHDAFAKTVTPFLQIFAKNPKNGQRAFKMKVRVEQGTDIPASLTGVPAEVAIQMPDRLRLSGPLLGENFTIVRDGEKIWISPGAKARALLDGLVDGKELPAAEKKVDLNDFRLPFNDKALVLLPSLFSVKDVGYQELDGVECRVQDVTMMKELADSLETTGWVSRLWIAPGHKPKRITVARKGWNIVVRFDEVEFAKSLPPETWKPTPEQAGDVLELKPREYGRFLKALGAKD